MSASPVSERELLLRVVVPHFFCEGAQEEVEVLDHPVMVSLGASYSLESLSG